MRLDTRDADADMIGSLRLHLGRPSPGPFRIMRDNGRIVVRMTGCDHGDSACSESVDRHAGTRVTADTDGCVHISASLPAGASMEMIEEAVLYVTGAFHTLSCAGVVGSRGSAETRSGDVGLGPLTAREEEVLIGIQSGLSNKLIARRLLISDSTVKAHVKSILRKTGTSNRTQAAVMASPMDVEAA